jgi:hypothetical protein
MLVYLLVHLTFQTPFLIRVKSQISHKI